MERDYSIPYFCVCDSGRIKYDEKVKLHICNNCGRIISRLEGLSGIESLDGCIFTDGKKLYKTYIVDSAWNSGLVPIETKQEINANFAELDFDREAKADGGVTSPYTYESMQEYSEEVIQLCYALLLKNNCDNKALTILNINEEINKDSDLAQILERKFDRHIRCKHCNSLVHAKYWKCVDKIANYKRGEFGKHKEERILAKCPICENLQKVDTQYESDMAKTTKKID